MTQPGENGDGFQGKIGQNVRKSRTEIEENILRLLYEWWVQGRQLTRDMVCEKMEMTRRKLAYYITSMTDHGYLEKTAGQEILLLTDFGKEQGADRHCRHQSITHFIQMTCGLDEEDAAENACRMEHVISGDVIEGIYHFLRTGEIYDSVVRNMDFHTRYAVGRYTFSMAIYQMDRRYPRVLAEDDPVFAKGDVIDEKPSQTPEEDDQNPGGDQGNEDNNKPSGDVQTPGTGAGQNQNTQNSQNAAQTPDAGAQKASLRTGATYTAGGNTYQAASAGTVALTAAANKKSVNVPATVNINGVTAKVTAIGNNAFKKARKKLTKVTIGANVTSIGKKAFAGCKKLKKITVKTKQLNSVGAKALKGISKNAVIKVPKKNKKVYTKLLKNKGQVKSVKIR